MRHWCFALLVLFSLTVVGCTTADITALTPTLLLYPDALDVLLVHEAVTTRVNEARVDQGKHPLNRDETLQELAEWQAWQVVKDTKPFDKIDDWPANQLGEPVIELRACLSDNVVTPDTVAQVAAEH